MGMGRGYLRPKIQGRFQPRPDRTLHGWIVVDTDNDDKMVNGPWTMESAYVVAEEMNTGMPEEYDEDVRESERDMNNMV